MKFITALFLTLSLTQQVFSANEFQPYETKEDIQKTINFLTSAVNSKEKDSTDNEAGLTYLGTAGKLKGLKLPLMYYCTTAYWKDYAKDLYLPLEETKQKPKPSDEIPTGERICLQNSCILYDAATWQIALSLAAAKEKLKGVDGEDLFSLAENQNTLLSVGYQGNAETPKLDEMRAASEELSYNGHSVTNPKKAYFLRLVPRSYWNQDPLVSLFPSHKKIAWFDWSATTGENVWAFLTGPLHAAQLHYQGKVVPFETPAVQNALEILPAFQKMQSEIGAFYAAVSSRKPLKNGVIPPSYYSTSVENNISTLGGFLVFRKVLQQELDFYTSADQQKTGENAARIKAIQEALGIIQTMIFGGDYECHSKECSKSHHHTAGVLSFLTKEAWSPDKKGWGNFYYIGEANNPSKDAAWVPGLYPWTVTDPDGSSGKEVVKAIDVNTWGVAVLGQPLIDKTHGFGAAYHLWDNIKKWKHGGAYQVNSELWGVGYSNIDRDSNQVVPIPNDHQGILSAEWTFGAITMVRTLIVQYGAVANSPNESEDHRNQAKQFIAQLQKDHEEMIRHIPSLRTDNYPREKTFAAVRPNNYAPQNLGNVESGHYLFNIPSTKLGYLYASKRYLIPFLLSPWYANPVPSMASTTWSIMVQYNFNPFSPNGDYSPNFSAEGK